MPLDTSIWDADLGYQIADLPVTVSFSGTDYQGTKSTVRRADVLADEGLRDQYRFSVTLQHQSFETAPAAGDVVTIGGTVWRVLYATLDDADIGLRLDLGERYGHG